MDKNSRYTPGFSPYLNSRAKRCFDLLAGVILLLGGLPLMLLIGMAVRIKEGKPVLFIQWRTGQNGKQFQIVKFRTLHQISKGNGASPCLAQDYRITWLGRFLRASRLDELPQLCNVLSGQMSLVGPRPALPHITAKYTAYHTPRLIAKPGLTGLWQVRGDRGKVIHHDMKYDFYYLCNASLGLDIKLLFMTLPYCVGYRYREKNYENSVCFDNLSLPN